MSAIVCSACGSNKLTESGGFYECPYCGTRFPRTDFSRQQVGDVPVIDFGSTSSGKNTARLLEKADLYKDMGKLLRARDLYVQVLEADPGNERARKGLAGLK